jgi:hypothetical protein
MAGQTGERIVNYPNCAEKDETKQQNLAKLRDFLLTNDVPFNMRDFRIGSEPVTKDTIDAGASSCGSAGCAIGWAPFVIPPTDDDFAFGYNEVQVVHFWDYTKHHLLTNGPQDIGFDAMFSSTWQHTDNTRHGAAFRINEYLERRVFDPYDVEDSIGDDGGDHEVYVFARDEWLAKQGEIS